MARKSKTELELEKTGYSPRRKNRFDLETLDELPDIGVDYDESLLTGSVDEICDLENCFLVDWRDPLELETINQHIEAPPIAWCEPSKGYEVCLCRGKIERSARKKFLDFYGINITIVTLANELLKGHYEIRVIRETMLDDHWVQIIDTANWWKKMDRNFGRRMDNLFVRIRDWNDFSKRIS